MTPTSGPPRIGVLGGTFDPVHNGHLHIARELREALGLERVKWVPAGRPPHKTGQIVSSDRDRLTMLALALADSPLDEISRIDLDRTGPSYTADTLEILREQVSPATLVFLMGEDSLRDLPTWHDPERILHAAELAVAGRPGIDANLDVLTQAIPALSGRVHLAFIDEVPVSSSDIRQRVRENRPIKGLVPAAVESYIRERGLYTSGSDPGW
jgi:nicotinate-nucleotide adenylyltransferase